MDQGEVPKEISKDKDRSKRRRWLLLSGLVAMAACFFVIGKVMAPHVLWMFNTKHKVQAKNAPAHGTHGGHGAHATHSNDAHADGAAHSPGSLGRLFNHYVQAIASVQQKIERLREADQENERLRLENANLKVRAESYQFECRAQEARRKTDSIEKTLLSQTGNKGGRVPASIEYKIPEHLLPQQLHTLASGYFKAKEYEKSAKILTFLLQMTDGEPFRLASTYLMAGVSWFRLDNYDMAESFFNQVLKTKENQTNQKYQAQARLWKAFVAKRVGKGLKMQYWLRELVDHHPYSVEANWVNPQEGKRALASRKKAPKSAKKRGH